MRKNQRQIKIKVAKVDNKRILLKFFILISGLVIIPIIAWVFNMQDKSIFFNSIVFIPIIIVWIISIYYSGWELKDFRIIGYIYLDNDKNLVILNKRIELKNIELVKIVFKDYFAMRTNIAGNMVSQGYKNKITIYTKDNRQFSYNIFLESKQDLRELKEFALTLLNFNLKVLFFIENRKVYP